MNVPFPVSGVSEDFAFSEPACRDALNVRGIDPMTGRLRGGVRSGTKRFSGDSGQIGSSLKVAHIGTVVTAASNQTIASLGNSLTQTWAKENTVTGDTLEVRAGSQGDVYSTDGNCGILKRNRDGAEVWKVVLAAEDTAHVVRALYIDATTPGGLGSDLVLAGVSTGGSSLKAKFWAYIQTNDNKVSKLWEIAPRGYVEEFCVSNDKLFVLMNFPDKNRAFVVVYDDYLTNTPTEIRRWTVPYPANSLAASPKDKFIFTASGANANRDVLPGSPKATYASEDWSIFDLPNYRERLWANLDASNRDTLGIEPRNLAYPNALATTPFATPPNLDDGGNVLAWVDASGQGRNLYTTANIIPTLTTAGTGYTKAAPAQSASRGAIYRATGGPNGGPCLHFDGITTGMVSELPASKDRANRHENLSLLPSYKGAQFVVCMVVRASADNVRRVLLSYGYDESSAATAGRYIAINKRVGFAIASTVDGNETPGQVSIEEANGVASDAAASATAAAAPTGENGRPLGAGLPDSGFAVITWICDGGLHDVFGTASRSLLRVNGRPADRWQSAPFSTILATHLGYAPMATAGTAGFVGDVCQIVVLHDWFDTTDTQQSLILGATSAAKSYPDANWSASQDSDIERLEGWLAHKWGIAHELPGGKAGWLTATANPAPADTVTVGSVTYTFSAAPAAANEVLVGAAIHDSMANLARAINRTGAPDGEYHRATTQNPDFRSDMPCAINNTPHYAILVRSRNPGISGVGVFAEASAVLSWNSANATPSINAGGGNRGWYPHPFFIEKTSTTVGGPPRTAGAAVSSPYWQLRSPSPILAAWDPANGKAKSVLTSHYNAVLGGAGSGVGGVGYAVRVASNGAVFSAGPRAALSAAGASVFAEGGFTADDVDVRKVAWVNQAFVTTGSATNDVWTWGGSSTPASPGALGYANLRMAVDKFDGLYVPYFGTGSTSLHGFKLAGTGVGTFNPVMLFDYSGLADANEAHAVAVDNTYPDFPTASTIKRAEHVILATRLEAVPTTKASLFKLRAVSVTQAVATPRTVKAYAIAGGRFCTFTTSAVTLVDGSAFDTARTFVDSAVLFGKAYITDGRQLKVYDPVAGTITAHVATSSGGVPQRCAIIAAWNGSLVLARQAENPNQYFISGQADAGDWDMNPYTINQAQAITGSDGSAGVPPDIINAFIPYTDDLAFLGGDHTIFRITGRPSPGGVGEIHLVSSSIGIAFGRAWCIDPRGILYFFGSRGGVYRMAPGGSPEPLSSGGLPYRSKIERRLQSIDLSAYTVQMAWSDADKGIHLAVCPFGAGGTVKEHYFWEEAGGGWFPDQWKVSAVQPTCLAVMDGDSANDRVVLMGCEDGYVRKFDRTANGDDVIPSTGVATYPIDSKVLIGPLAPKDSAGEYIFSGLEIVLAQDQGARPFVEVYVTDRPDFLGQAVYSGRIGPGLNPRLNFKARGAYVFLQIRSQDLSHRWAFESAKFHQITPCGMKRAMSA